MFKAGKQLPRNNIDPKKPTFFVSTCNLTSSSTEKLEGTITGDQKQRYGYYECPQTSIETTSLCLPDIPGARSPPKGSTTTLPPHPTSQLLVETCARKDGFLSFVWKLHILTQCAFSHNILASQSYHLGLIFPKKSALVIFCFTHLSFNFYSI